MKKKGLCICLTIICNHDNMYLELYELKKKVGKKNK